ncbi:3-deoxy-D-manno-octulosonate 8-phosphate phosphatase [Robbsia andropogonis]|uniref:3-deoxy-D-manno-octulosonate 8-phosphate phosphatase KdsC n=1 Tax=Robbsia andropogonis TaxID=28092 RepID=A0A0F5K5N8_9BURK|nr:3-deoxy-D-manno-octulosonate 8-phosphate phosphatase [Robbsia andropogonis]KKB65413.1 3-deoxy-D-manno-octulosonate 8-phosphate phosphatase [Robbsia andropogonis]MCP1117151.1 3-deoxy-D-manno-octulosonate 8-phosphate phosphatase [Robbsia andropogonis]MCP1128497.1 3-deoxy-D-manno-octulosonate 8-phosphate phosphatase [Robbsia andropogonis]
MAFDIDGVFTSGEIYYGADGEMLKAFHTLDGHGVKQLARCGIEVAIITGRESGIVSSRARELGITRVFQGVKQKDDVLAALRAELQLQDMHIGYMGDDWPDLPVLCRVGLACAPANAHTDVKARVHVVTQARGGEGAVREVCDLILRATGHYDALLAQQCRS